jgi:hypothetical protein
MAALFMAISRHEHKMALLGRPEVWDSIERGPTRNQMSKLARVSSKPPPAKKKTADYRTG